MQYLLSAQSPGVIRSTSLGVPPYRPPSCIIDIAELLAILQSGIRTCATGNDDVSLGSPVGRRSQPGKAAGNALAQGGRLRR